MEVAAACVTANCNQLHSGSSGLLEETESKQLKLKKIQQDICIFAVKQLWMTTNNALPWQRLTEKVNQIT